MAQQAPAKASLAVVSFKPFFGEQEGESAELFAVDRLLLSRLDSALFPSSPLARVSFPSEPHSSFSFACASSFLFSRKRDFVRASKVTCSGRVRLEVGAALQDESLRRSVHGTAFSFLTHSSLV